MVATVVMVIMMSVVLAMADNHVRPSSPPGKYNPYAKGSEKAADPGTGPSNRVNHGTCQATACP
jgi:hypothetical protein